jgi:hypothetical protein
MDKYCQNCNQPNPFDAAFCRKCAFPLPPEGQPAGGQQGNVNQGQQPNQQWNQPNFGSDQQGGQNFAQTTGGTSQRGLIAVILVGVGLICCGPFTGIPAAIVGWLEMTAIKEGRSPKDGMWMAQVGLWGGIVVSILGSIGYFLLLLMSMASPGY